MDEPMETVLKGLRALLVMIGVTGGAAAFVCVMVAGWLALTGLIWGGTVGDVLAHLGMA